MGTARIRSYICPVAVLLAAAFFATAAQAAPGELDPTFGTAGGERIFRGQEETRFEASVVGADDRPILVGDRNGAPLVVRLGETGAIDPTFGSAGSVSFAIPGGTEPSATAVAVQPDGRILVAGGVEVTESGDEQAFVVRLLADGRLDPSFGGGDGIEVVPFGTEASSAYVIGLGAGGRILLTGAAFLTKNGAEEVGVAVLGSDGKPDTEFSADGVLAIKTPNGEGEEDGFGIAEAPGGGFVIVDGAGTGAGHGFVLVKLLADGTPDIGFGVKGVVEQPTPGSDAGLSLGLAIQPDGRIVVAGSGFDEVGGTDTNEKFVAARFLADGTLDGTFGTAGFAVVQISAGEDVAFQVLRAASGKLYLTGSWEPAANNFSPAVVRLTPNGTLDPSFGEGGIVRRPVLAPQGDGIAGTALDSHERLLVPSLAHEGNGTTATEVIRILGDVAPPAAPGPPAPPNRPPFARIKGLAKVVDGAKLKGFFGTAADLDGEPLRKVQIALVRKVGHAPKAHASPAAASAAPKQGRARTCLDLRNAKGGFKQVHAKQGKPCRRIWLTATGTSKWAYRLRGVLPAGRYVLFARAVDSAGLAESIFTKKAGNRRAFRIR